jgi:Cu/Ag efflux pump CusA
MVIANGAGAASRRALGVPVFYGMLIGTVVGLVLIPLFYMLVQSQVERYARYKAKKRGQIIEPHPDELKIR